jgi:hypothetical protein
MADLTAEYKRIADLASNAVGGDLVPIDAKNPQLGSRLLQQLLGGRAPTPETTEKLYTFIASSPLRSSHKDILCFMTIMPYLKLVWADNAAKQLSRMLDDHDLAEFRTKAAQLEAEKFVMMNPLSSYVDIWDRALGR